MLRNKLSAIILMAAMLFPAACGIKEEVPETLPEAPYFSFRAVMGDETKATMSDSGKGSWEAGDQIAVFDTESNKFCTFTSEKGDGVFTFEGEPGVTYTFTRAYYPASIVKNAETITLKDSYTMAELESAKLFPMMAKEFGETMTFYHLGALTRLSFTSLPANTSTLSISSAEVSLSGDFTPEESALDNGQTEAEGEGFTIVDNVPVKADADTRMEIHAKAGSGAIQVSIPAGTDATTLYVPLPVGSFNIKIDLKTGDSVLEQHSSSFKDIKRASLIILKPIGEGLFVGKGTEDSPYLLETATQFKYLADAVATDAKYRSAYYEQTADFDLSGETLQPVGTEGAPFSGHYNGGGHKIQNMSVSSTGDNAGMFGYMEGGSVSDINFESASVAGGGKYVGTVVGYLMGGTVKGIRVDAESKVTSAARGAGLIAGYVRSGIIRECATHGFATAGTDCVGGISGYLNPGEDGHDVLVINCTFEPVYKDGHLYGACLEESNASAFMGGITGSANLGGGKGRVRIVNCYAYPLQLSCTQPFGTTVSGIGGISGYAGTSGTADGVTFFNCITPVTYSNVLVGGTRLGADNRDTYAPKSAAIVGNIASNGVVVKRTFSTNTWNKAWAVSNSATVTSENITKRMGDGNMRGFSLTVLGEKTFTEADGGVKTALNEGVAEWNAASPEVEAIKWDYDPTFGYPKPVGVDVPGVKTKKVSVIGDSISTYQGFIFSNESAQMGKHYPNTGGTAAEKAKWAPQVFNEQLTWWWRLIYDKMDNARLEVNNAWGGTTVSYVTEKTPNMGVNVSASCQKNSLQQRYLDHGLGHPDILFYFGGRNDYGHVGGNSHDLLGEYTVEALQAAYDAAAGTLYPNYSQGTVAILRDFLAKHPKCKVMMMITDLMTDQYEDAAQAITDFFVDKGFDVKFANLHKRGTTNKINNDIGVIKEEGSHPNATGCENIANYIWNNLGSWLNE